MRAVAGLADRSTVAFAARLRDHGGRPAVVAANGEVTYEQLAERVERVAERLGPDRRLVLVPAGNDVGSLVAYLGALWGGHAVLLGARDNPAHLDRLTVAYRPDAVVAAGADGDADVDVEEHRPGTFHDLHPDLALLLSTSGTTGSSKLVRLSPRNLGANAAAIASYLEIGPHDRAMTSLPMHYCYGLSVINSHLLAGAALVVTDLSVVDACFWDRFRSAGATSFAGVPYTFDLLDRVGFDRMALPTLRYVTQAGGRLPPERVRRYGELGRRDGWDFVVMYGQTEATARMAYLPADRVLARPAAIGVAIPGGTLRLDPVAGAEAGVGELVYQGPNVMLGYAEAPADLALGAVVDELRTGDLARRTPDGLYEIVGRRARFVKLFGLRVDLDQVEAALAARGIDALCAGDDDGLVLAVAGGVEASLAVAVAADHTRLPRARVRAVPVAELPRRANGKPDYAAVARLGRPADHDLEPPDALHRPAGDGVHAVRAALAAALQVDEIDDEATFVGLGGDSLSYVEAAIRLEQVIGPLPAGWHTLQVRELAAAGRARGRLSWIETSVVLRAVAIALVVGTHVGAFHLPGGAHVLLGVAGYNFARFSLTSGRVARSILRVAVPSACWIGLVAATTDEFALPHALFLNAQLGAPDARWAYWFVEAMVQLLAVLAVLLAIPAVRGLERARPVAVAFAVLAAGLAVRFDLAGLPHLDHRTYRPSEVLWLFAAGWVAARVTTAGHRLALSAALVLAVPGFFGDGHREALVLAGLLLLVWVPHLPAVRPAGRLAAVLAGASLYVYLIHWQVFPLLGDVLPPGPTWAATLVVGVVCGSWAQRAVDAGERGVHRLIGARR